MNEISDIAISAEATVREATLGYGTHDAHDAPHECEFCSPEPLPIPAPWERAAGEGAREDTEREGSLTAAITQLWT
jgi:hypothetical protein